MTALIAVSGPLAGVLIGWLISRRSENTSLHTAATQRQLGQVCELDRCVSAALASLQAYEKRLLVGQHLENNGRSSTKEPAPDPGSGKTARPASAAPRRGPLGEPLDGKTLLSIKREADEHIWKCTSALARATACLDEEAVLRAHELVEALVTTRETLEAQEGNGDASPEEMSSRVAALHRARTRFLNTARQTLHVEALSDATTERVERLSEQAFSPSRVPRPYVATGVRVSKKRR